MFNEETPAFKAAFVLVEKLVFGVKKFRTLFASGKSIRGGGEGNSLRGIFIVAWGMTERRFTGVVASARRTAVLLGNRLVFFPLGAQYVITSFNLVKPFMEVLNLIQLFREHLL